MRGKLLASMPLILLSACSSTKNVSLKHSDPAMVTPARFEQELAECRAWAEGTPSQDGPEGELEPLPAAVADYAVSLCLRDRGYVQIDADGKPVDDYVIPPGFDMRWSRAGTAEATYYRDSRECGSTAEVNAGASHTDSFRASWIALVSSYNFCMKRKGYECMGSLCTY